MTEQLTRSQYVEEAWKRGILHWKLRPHQLPIYNAIRNAKLHSNSRLFAVNCARRFGKSTVGIVILFEDCLRTKDGVFRFVTGTQKQMRNIVFQILPPIIKDCPKHIMPEWKTNDGCYYFPSTGSRLYINGANNGHEDDSRGEKTHKALVDEAETIDNLDYLIMSVLMPQTLEQDGGQIILTYTPAETPAHDCKKFNDRCKLEGNYCEFTIYDNQTLDEETIEQYAEEYGGRESTAFKREYECRWVVEEKRVIIGTWDDKYIVDVPKPKEYDFYDKYMCMDVGFSHWTCVLYGYWDYLNAQLIIEDEWKGRGWEMTTETIANGVKEKQEKLWGNQKPYRKIADSNNPQLLNDLGKLYGVYFNQELKLTLKGRLDATINRLKDAFKKGMIIVNPKCEYLILCLQSGIWNKTRDKFDEDDELGHYDGIAALMYMWRHIDFQRNPIPVTYNIDLENSHISEEMRKKMAGGDSSHSINELKKAIGGKMRLPTPATRNRTRIR